MYLVDKLGFLSRAVKEYGKPVRLHLGQPTLLLTDPDDVHHVLVDHPGNYSKTPHLDSERGRRLFGRGLLTASSSAHRRQRQVLQPAFTPRAISRYGAVVVECIRNAVDSISTHPEVELCGSMEELTKSVIVGVLLGSDYHDASGKLSRAIRDHREFIEYVYRTGLPFAEHLPLPVVRREQRAQHFLSELIGRHIALRRSSGTSHHDLLQAFMDATYPDGLPMEDEIVLDEAITMLSTGYETLGDALAWTQYLLAKHPMVLQRLRDEVDHVVGNRWPQAADVPHLGYVDQVFSEALRLYPPTWIFVRVANDRDRLPSGEDVPQGTKIYLCPYIMHRHPRWFPAPEAFDPGRFAPSEVQQRPRHAYFPFGGGPRVCIGEHLARMEAVLVLSALAQRFTFELTSGSPPVARAGVTLRPKHGLLARRQAREQA